MEQSAVHQLGGNYRPVCRLDNWDWHASLSLLESAATRRGESFCGGQRYSLLNDFQERRRNIRRHRIASSATEEYELTSFGCAIGHAFIQPDIEFLSNDGAFASASDDEVA